MADEEKTRDFNLALDAEEREILTLALNAFRADGEAKLGTDKRGDAGLTISEKHELATYRKAGELADRVNG
jgi:hypothetical protein